MHQTQLSKPAPKDALGVADTSTVQLQLLIAAVTVAFIVGACTEATVLRIQGAAVRVDVTDQRGAGGRDGSVPAAWDVLGIHSAASEEPAPTF